LGLTNRKNAILTGVALLVLNGSLLFQSGLYAAAQSERGKSGPDETKRVSVDSLSGTGGLKSTIFFTARDSVIYNLDRRTMKLWGKARIEHESRSVNAPEIELNLNTSMLEASGRIEASKKLSEPALFTDKQGSFTADTINYNFSTGRGESSNVASSSSEMLFEGKQVTRLGTGEFNISNGSFTTCDEESPHYWISSSNITVIPGNKVSAHPIVMYIRPEIFSRRLPAIPILALPYMDFSLKKGQRISGFLTPGISSESNRGYYLSNLGYFWAINDYTDLRLESDVALNGSWRIGNRFRYRKSNEFSTTLSGEFRRYFLDDDERLHRDWNAKMVHNQVFNPATRLDVNLDFQGGDRLYDLNAVNSETILTDQANARASLGTTFNDESGIATLFYDSTKDLRNQNGAYTLGTSFYQNRIYPFRSGFSSGLGDWKKDISISTGADLSGSSAKLDAHSSTGYAANAHVELGYSRNFADGYNALFSQGVSFQRIEPVAGVHEDAYSSTSVQFPLRMQSTLFRYFNINPGLTFTRFFNSDGPERDFSTVLFSVDATTRLYGTLDTGGLFEGLLGLKAVRHVFIPTVTYAWNPAFSGTGYGYNPHLNDGMYSQFYNRFENSLYSALPEGQKTVGITLKNLVQGKFRGSSDEVVNDSVYGDHTTQLLSLTLSGAYNFSDHLFPLAPLFILAQSNALSQNLLLSTGAVYDFYTYDLLSGERISRFNHDEGRGLLRFVKGFLNMSFSVQGSREEGASKPSSASPYPLNAAQSILHERFNTVQFTDIDYGLPWQLSFSLYLQSDRSKPLEPATSSLVSSSARFTLSKHWQVALNSGYDFQERKMVFPMLQLYHDMHCWQMSLQWVPSGSFRSYAIQIGLKAPQLKDIKFSQSGRAPELL
jgi:hypothetical protein